MVTHIILTVSNIERSLAFYKAPRSNSKCNKPERDNVAWASHISI
jgi:catechol 2,3-dioxygenase-like lactoylglutathione lyase family enzyme